MHKKFLRTASKLLGFAMIGLIVNTSTRGMDSADDPYWRGGASNASKYHVGMKDKAEAATSKTLTDLDNGLWNLPRKNTTDAQSGRVVCSCCKTFVLESSMTKAAYTYSWKNHMSNVCNEPYGESKYYRWTWLSY